MPIPNSDRIASAVAEAESLVERASRLLRQLKPAHGELNQHIDDTMSYLSSAIDSLDEAEAVLLNDNDQE